MRKDRVNKGRPPGKRPGKSGSGRKSAGKGRNIRSERTFGEKKEGGFPERKERSRSFSKTGGSSGSRSGGYPKSRDENRSASPERRERGSGRDTQTKTLYNGDDKRKSFSRDKPPFKRRDSSGPERNRSSDRKSGERVPYNREDKRRGFSKDKSPFKRRDNGNSGRGSSYGENETRRPYNSGDRKKYSGERAPFEKRGRPQTESRDAADKRTFRNKRDDDSFAGNERSDRSSAEKRPFEKRETSRSEGEKRPRVDKDANKTSGGFRSSGEKRERSAFPDKRKERSDRFSSTGSDLSSRWNRKESHQFYGEKRGSIPNLPKTADDGSVRLNKFIANAGICSRREADEMIAAGVISVNGVVITEMGYKVKPDDNVKYNNESLRSERLIYILLNKPKDFITTTDDPEDRKTVMNLIAKACKERVYPVGRLDRNTTGVLLFTNDGDLAKKLTHPSFQMQKVYQAELDKALKPADMKQIEEGVTLEDGFVKPDDVVYTNADKKVIGMELHSGKNRIVRRIFEHLGYEVKKLDRVVFAGLTKKDLPRGRWRFLTDLEVANLKMMTGKKSTKAL